LLKRKEEERFDPCSLFLQFLLLYIDFEHIFERFRAKRSKITRRVSLCVLSNDVEFACIANFANSHLGTNGGGKTDKNPTTLSLLKVKIPAEAEFMQTRLNYGGSCNILLYATMNQHS
jgi:hypothetical protein